MQLYIQNQRLCKALLPTPAPGGARDQPPLPIFESLRLSSSLLSSLALDSCIIGYQLIGLRPLIERPRSSIARAATFNRDFPRTLWLPRLYLSEYSPRMVA